MAATSSDYELLTEHFSYPPVSLLDDIINTVNVLADRALDSVERLLLSIPPQNLGFASSESPGDAAKLEIESGTHQLETLLNASIDKNFDLFELYAMRNILTVRPEDQPFMRLSHYEGLDLDRAVAEGSAAEGESGSKEEESVNALRRRLHASQRLHVALEKERASNDVLLRGLRRAMGVKDTSSSVKGEESPESTHPSAFGFLQNKGSLEEGGTKNPIATTTEFTLSQLQALRALSTSLRTILPELEPSPAENADGESSSGGRSWRRERVEYVEGASRKYLESHGGLDLGEQGEVRDGEWRGEGQGVGRDEVEGLERMLAILGSGQGAQQAQGSDAAGNENAS
ncbi:mis12 protein [Sarocladium implicatum]|nr:mis12 protein [Sarocladium implicatum]